MSYDDQWLDILKEMTEVADTIKSLVPGLGLWNSADEDFFRYYFADRMVNIGKSVASLTELGFFHEAGVAARTAVEGLLYFEAYKRTPSLARLFRLFGIYEGYDETYRTARWHERKRQREQKLNDETAVDAAAKAAADKWLYDLKKRTPESFVKDAEQEFEFEKRGLKWHKWPLRDLVRSIKPVEQEVRNRNSQSSDEELEELVEYISSDDPWGDLFYFTYHALSQVAHWTPIGVVNWEDAGTYVNSALTATIHCLFTIAVSINDEYKEIQFDNDLSSIKDRYNRKAKETLRNMQAL